MKNNTKEPAVVQVARERQGVTEDGVHVLSTGVRVRLLPVSASLISDVQSRYEYPEAPMWHNETKGRDEPNYNDPTYLRTIADVDQQRGMAAFDAVAMFGIELIDGLPEDDSWIAKLKLLGIEFDGEDLVSREFHYKRYVAVAIADTEVLNKVATIKQEDIARAEGTFRSDEERETDSGASS